MKSPASGPKATKAPHATLALAPCGCQDVLQTPPVVILRKPVSAGNWDPSKTNLRCRANTKDFSTTICPSHFQSLFVGLQLVESHDEP